MGRSAGSGNLGRDRVAIPGVGDDDFGALGSQRLGEHRAQRRFWTGGGAGDDSDFPVQTRHGFPLGFCFGSLLQRNPACTSNG